MPISRGDNVTAGGVKKAIDDILAEFDMHQHTGYAKHISEFGIKYRTYHFGVLHKNEDEQRSDLAMSRLIAPLADQLLRLRDVFEEACKSGHRVVVWRLYPEAENIQVPGKSFTTRLRTRLHFMTMEDYKTATSNAHTLKAYRDRKLMEAGEYNAANVFSLDNYLHYDDPKKLPEAPQELPSFSWALKQLRDNKKVTRQDWSDGCYLEIVDNRLWLWYAMGRDLWNADQDDLLAYDWSIVTPAKTDVEEA